MVDVIPNIFLLGPSKTGSTSLFDLISKSKQVASPKPKETMFFARDIYSEGHPLYNSFYPDYVEGNFDNRMQVLEASTINLLLPYVPERIVEFCNQRTHKFRFIIVVRDPWERSYSHWSMINGYRPGRTFKSFARAMVHNLESFNFMKFELEGDYMANTDYKGGCYVPYFIEANLLATQIKRYLEIFSNSDFLVLDFRKLDDHETRKKLSKFLGIELTGEMPHSRIGMASKEMFAAAIEEISTMYPKEFELIDDIFSMEQSALQILIGDSFYE